MVKRDELIGVVHDLLGKDLLDTAVSLDSSANGVQVHGKEEVETIALGVSCNLDFLNEAVSAGADMTLTHHGLNLSEKYLHNARLDPAAQARLRVVFSNDITVSAYHYTLDAHKEFGNNVVIIRKLGAKRLDIPYFETWGWVGEFAKPIPLSELADKCAQLFSHDIYAVYSSLPSTKIRRIGVCSGGARPAGKTLFEALEKGVELHICGEIVEGLDHVAKESGLNYFACGHYATEVFGVQELGKKLKNRYRDKLEIEFIDIPNIL